MFIEWKNSMSVGVSESDIQHQKMISIINDFFDILRSENKKNYVEILKRLEDYADYHFSFEEKYFEEFDYEDKDFHIKQHRLYSDKVGDFKKRLLDNELIENELLDFLKNWWINHINNSDFKYMDCFNSHGLH